MKIVTTVVFQQRLQLVFWTLGGTPALVWNTGWANTGRWVMPRNMRCRCLFFFKILSSVWIDEGYVCMSVFHIPLTFFPKYFLSYVFSGCYLKPQWLQTARVNQFCPVGVCHLCSIHVEQLSWAWRSPWDSSVHGWRRSQLWASRTVGCRPWVLSR